VVCVAVNDTVIVLLGDEYAIAVESVNALSGDSCVVRP
jgi:hypothetical protein